jgi:hypothetical protein
LKTSSLFDFFKKKEKDNDESAHNEQGMPSILDKAIKIFQKQNQSNDFSSFHVDKKKAKKTGAYKKPK